MCSRYPPLEGDVIRHIQFYKSVEFAFAKFVVRNILLSLLVVIICYIQPAISDSTLYDMRLFYSPVERNEKTRFLAVDHSAYLDTGDQKKAHHPTEINVDPNNKKLSKVEVADNVRETISFDALLAFNQSLSLIVQGVYCSVLTEIPERGDAPVRCRDTFSSGIELRYSINRGLLFVYSHSRLVASLKPGEKA